MIVVTGATGRFGRSVLEGLLEHLPPERVGASVRDPAKAGDLAQRGVRVRLGDFAEPETLRYAFEGASCVLIVSGTTLGDEGVRQHGHAIDAVKAAGAERVVYTSHQAASPSSRVAFGPRHAATEALLRSSGLPFVSLRNGFYAESALYQLGGIETSGRLALPEDGPVSWTARDDLARAAVASLLDPDLFHEITPPLTAAAAITFADIARMAATVLGRSVERIVVDDDAYAAEKRALGLPEPLIPMSLAMFAATRAGEFDVVDPTLARVLGREPTAMEAVLRSYLSPAARTGPRVHSRFADGLTDLS